MRSFVLFLLLTIVLAKNFKKYPGVDCLRNDIRNAGTQNVDELKKICSEDDECVGFNTHGWLKKACPSVEVIRQVDTYLLDTIPMPSGEEPDTLIWPMPVSYKSGNEVTTIDVLHLHFHVNYPSDEMTNAINRSTIFTRRFPEADEKSIKQINIEIKNKYVEFVTDKDESYTLNVPDDGSDIEITADNIYGAYHALNSLMFLIQYHYETNSYIIKHSPIKISDHPFLHYRGLMIDSSRHFLPIRSIKSIIDAMSWTKLNVLHWHLVDDQSFPVQIRSVPSMWQGSYTKNERYTHWDIEEIVAYAKARGVHVIPEFDVPGHAQSWCIGNPSMCPSAECNTPLDPSVNVTFITIDSIMNDMLGSTQQDGLFPGQYFHIGGDEVDTSCWNKVEHVKQWLTEKGFSEKDAYAYFINKVSKLVKKHNRQVIAWEEVYNNHKAVIDKDTIIQVWLGDGENFKNVVKDGFRAIISNLKHWYLPQLWETWDYYYGNDFLKDIPKEQWHLVHGGEVCMWGEWVDASDFESTIMPRSIAAAERMWTQPELLDIERAKERFPYIRCEYNRRGIGASPAFGQGRSSPPGPNSCLMQ